MLTVDQITEVRLRLERGESIRSIAKSTGLNRRTITKIKRLEILNLLTKRESHYI